MDVRGKANMFVEKSQKKDGTEFVRASISIGTKKEDGSYLNKSLRLVFDKTAFPEEKLLKLDPNLRYEVEICEGWLTVREYAKKDGTLVRDPAIFVKAMRILEKHEKGAKSEADAGLDW